MDFLKKNYVLILIIFLGFFLRFNIDIFAEGYIFDELAIVSLAKSNNFFNLLNNIANLDYHAPFYYLLIRPFVNLDNEWIHLRILNLLISVFNIFVFYRIGLLLKDKKLGYALAALLAVNHMHISVVSFVKFYCLCFLILSLILLYFIKVLIKEKGYIKLAILNALFCLSNTFGFVFIGIECFIIFLLKKRRIDTNSLKLFLISFLGFVLYLPILFIQSKYALSNIISPHGAYPSFSLFSLYGIFNDYVSPLLNFSAPLETIEANSLILKVAKDFIKYQTIDWLSLIPFVFLSFIPVVLSIILCLKTAKNRILKPVFCVALSYLIFFSILVCIEISGSISLYVFPFGILFIFLVGCGIDLIRSNKVRVFVLSYFVIAQLVIPNVYPLSNRSPEKIKLFDCPIKYIKNIDDKTPVIVTVGGRFLKEYFNNKNLYHFDNEQMGASHDKKFIRLIYGNEVVNKANKKNIDKVFAKVILNNLKKTEFKNYVNANIFSKIKKGEKMIFIMNSDENSFIANEKYIIDKLSRNDYNYHLTDSRFFSLLKEENENLFSIMTMEDIIMSYSYQYLIELIDDNFKIINVQQYSPFVFNKWKMVYENENFNKNTMWLAKNVVNGWIFVTYEKI